MHLQSLLLFMLKAPVRAQSLFYNMQRLIKILKSDMDKILELQLCHNLLKENYIWIVFRSHRWLLLVILEIKKSVCTTEKHLTLFGDYNQHLAFVKIVKESQLMQMTKFILNMSQLLIFCQVTILLIKINSVVKWKYLAWHLLLKTKHRYYSMKHKELRLEKMFINMYQYKTHGLWD